MASLLEPHLKRAEKKIREDTILAIIHFFIKKYIKECKEVEMKLMKFDRRMDEFTERNMQSINRERAKLMLGTPLEKLKLINQKELKPFADFTKKSIEQGKKDKEVDHLPFSNLKKQIAATLPNAPKKPLLNVELSMEYFIPFI